MSLIADAWRSRRSPSLAALAHAAAVPFDALVEGVLKLEPLVPEIALKPPYKRYPGDPMIELRAKEGHYARLE